METENILAGKIRQAAAEGRKALIPFVPGGFPDKKSFWEIVMELDQSGADIIEIGVPFSDPVADGPVVERASIKCLEQGINLSWIITGLEKYRSAISAGIVLMGYFNPFMQYGMEKLVRDAGKAGVNGLIVPDLILEEAEPYFGLLKSRNLSLIPLVGLNTPRQRMEQYSRKNPAFVYLVSVLGITGTRASAHQLLKTKLQEVRDVFECPAALGFGLSSKDQLEPLSGLVDGVVFGSALIKHLESGGKAAEFIKAWQ